MAERPLGPRPAPPALETGIRIERLRTLPAGAEVLVEPGDRLEPADTVARWPEEQAPVPLDVAALLGVSTRHAHDCLCVVPGQTVDPHTVVARCRRGPRWRRVEAGMSGTVAGFADGCLLLRPAPRWQPVRAYVAGVVAAVLPGRGVLVETTGSVLRGIWGAGGESAGRLRVETEHGGDRLLFSRVSRRHAGAVVAGGTLQSRLLLERAANSGVAGLVVGSLHPGLIPLCRYLPFPVVVTEGVGDIPMAGPAFDLLRAHDGGPAMIAGRRQESGDGPEIILSGALAHAGAPAARRPLMPGDRVRLTGSAHLGACGEIVRLPDRPRVLAPADPPVEGAEVRLEDRRLLFVPLANLELLSTERPETGGLPGILD